MFLGLLKMKNIFEILEDEMFSKNLKDENVVEILKNKIFSEYQSSNVPENFKNEIVC